MSLIADRIQKAAASRRFRPVYGPPDSLRKVAAWTFNPDQQANRDDAAETVALGALQSGDGFMLVEPSATATHGIVKGEPRNGQVMVGTGNRYLPAATAVQSVT
jgi:hypothetical protein